MYGNRRQHDPRHDDYRDGASLRQPYAHKRIGCVSLPTSRAANENTRGRRGHSFCGCHSLPPAYGGAPCRAHPLQPSNLPQTSVHSRPWPCKLQRMPRRMKRRHLRATLPPCTALCATGALGPLSIPRCVKHSAHGPHRTPAADGRHTPRGRYRFRKVMRPFVRSYGEISQVTLSPTRILMTFLRILPDT